MTCPCSVSRYRWLRNLCSLVCAVVGCCSLPAARAQSPDLEKPLLNIDDDISAFAFAPDGRIVSFRWSPNGRLILAQLFTTSVVDERGATQDSTMTLALEDNGKEIHLGANDSLLKDAADASWLLDNATIVYLTEIVKPRVLFSFKYINVAAGP